MPYTCLGPLERALLGDGALPPPLIADETDQTKAKQGKTGGFRDGLCTYRLYADVIEPEKTLIIPAQECQIERCARCRGSQGERVIDVAMCRVVNHRAEDRVPVPVRLKDVGSEPIAFLPKGKPIRAPRHCQNRLRLGIVTADSAQSGSALARMRSDDDGAAVDESKECVATQRPAREIPRLEASIGD